MSTIRRVNRPADNFTMISNGFVRDGRLSLAARGLGTWLLSHVDGWETTTDRIAQLHSIGRDQTRRYLRELEDAGYLRRTRERGETGRLGAMAYEIQCTPIEPENARSDLRLADQSQAGQGRVSGGHKKTTSKKTTTPEEKPSGGTSAAAASPSLDSPIPEEDPMTPPAADTLTLFDVPATAQKQGRERPLSAQTVAAAYVEAFRAHRSGGEPLKRDTGRVARDAAALLRSGEAGPEELAAAAREMGKTQYSNLAMALKIHRERKPGSNQGFAPASPYTNPYWQDIGRDKQERWVHKILTDDATLEFVLRDPAEVQRLCAQHPELATRFGRVA